jgi:hypothetical protein
LAAMLDSRVIFIILIIIPMVIFIIQIIIFLILIIILNLHDLSLSESACKIRLKSLGSCCNTKPKSLGYKSDCKVVSWKYDN